MSSVGTNNYLNYLTAIVKPEQSGKTYEMIEAMIAYRREIETSNIIPIDIIITDLNISLINQTYDRLEEKLFYSNNEDDYIKDIFKNHRLISFNSKDKRFKSKNDVYMRIEEDYSYLRNDDSDSDCDSLSELENDRINGSIICCCCHKQRWMDLFGDGNIRDSLIYKINRLRTKDIKFKFNIWCDEVDVYIDKIEKYIYPMIDHKSINLVINGLSATVEKLYKKYNCLKIKPYKRTYVQDLYHNWSVIIFLKKRLN